jgi:replicative DNA helicase
MGTGRGKRGLAMPGEDQVPAGPHRQLLLALHEAYRAAGRPSLRQIALGLKRDDDAPATLNYQAVGKVLNGRTIPTPRQLVSLASWLTREGNVTREYKVNEQEFIKDLQVLLNAVENDSLGIPESDESGAEKPDTIDSGTEIARSILAAENTIQLTLLSSMLRSESAIAEVVERVKVDLFVDEFHRAMYTVLLGLYGNHEEITLEVVAKKIEKDYPGRGTLHDVETIAGVPCNPDEAGEYANLALKIAKARNVAILGRALTDLAGRSIDDDGEPDIGTLVDLAQQTVITFMDEIHRISSVSEVLESSINEAAGVDRRVTGPGIPSGFRELDSLTAGFRPGELILVGGAPGIGKSTAALDFLRHCSIAHGHTSLLVSLQMGREEAAMRMISAESRVSLQAMRSAEMTDEDWERVARAMPSISKAPIYISDEPACDVGHFVSTCEWLVHVKDLRLAIIDTIDLMDNDSTQGASNPEQSLLHGARELRRAARNLEVPVIALFHTDRVDRRQGDRIPQVRDVPGVLEKYADKIILIHREDAYDYDSPRAGEADFIVTKNRTGPTGVATVAFQGHYARFVDM